MLEKAGASGGPGAPSSGATSGAAGGAPAAEGPGAAGASGGPGAAAKKSDPELVAGASGGPKAAAELKAADAKKASEAGASGGPGAKQADDDELVDPDADRPNFGSASDDDEAEDEEESAQAAKRAAAAKTAKPVKARKPINPAYATAAMMGGIVVSILAVLWFGRAEIAKMLPEFQTLYDRVGVEAPRPGDGLSISESAKRLQRISGVETLVVQGFVSNIGEIPRTVPGLRLELYNERKEPYKSQAIPAPAAVLDPAGSAAYEIRLPFPDLSQAKGGYAVVWDVE